MRTKSQRFHQAHAKLNFHILFKISPTLLKKVLDIGWIPGFLEFLNSVNENCIWMAQIVELQKSFEMIQNFNQFLWNQKEKIHFLIFVWAFV